MKRAHFWFIFILISFFSSSSYAETTQLMIRAKAVDAKFIGTSVGGIRVVVEDAETNEILDAGWINGGTGSTERLITNPIVRRETLSDDTTAGYLAHIDIKTPRLVRIKLIGPYGYRESAHEATLTTWILPGKDILGDGIIITMTGFIIDSWTNVIEGGRVDLYAKASLLCGCPIYPDGPWDPKNYEVSAMIMNNDTEVEQASLEFTGPTGIFSGRINITTPGHYKAIITIFDKQSGNVGVSRSMFEITAP